jgi:uncharacterized protein YggE
MKIWIWILAFSVNLAIASKEEFINVSGKGSVQIFPDQVTLTFGVSQVDKKLDSAVGKVSKVANNLIAICKSYRIEDKYIETVSNSLERAYKNDRDTATYLGIKSEIIYEVVLFQIDSVNSLLNKMYRNGMNDFRGFSFSYTKQDSLKRIASEIAIKDAYSNANVLAVSSGKKIKGLLNASYEKPEDFSFRPQTRHEGLWAGAGMGSLYGKQNVDLEFFKIKPGLLNFEIEVFAKYEIY